MHLAWWIEEEAEEYRAKERPGERRAPFKQAFNDALELKYGTYHGSGAYLREQYLRGRRANEEERVQIAKAVGRLGIRKVGSHINLKAMFRAQDDETLRTRITHYQKQRIKRE